MKVIVFLWVLAMSAVAIGDTTAPAVDWTKECKKVVAFGWEWKVMSPARLLAWSMGTVPCVSCFPMGTVPVFPVLVWGQSPRVKTV